MRAAMVGVALASSFSSAHAQTFTGAVWMPDYISTAAMDSQIIANNAISEAIGNDADEPRRARPDLGTRSRQGPSTNVVGFAADARAPISNRRFVYAGSPAVSAEVKRGLVQRITRFNANAGREVSAQLAQHDPFSIYSNIVTPFGLRRGDLADSMTAYTILAWAIANNELQSDPDGRAKAAAVRARVAGELARNAAVRDPANRQRMDEELMYLFVILHAGWQSARAEGKFDQYSDGVAATFRKQFGRDLRRLELTTTGFVERG